LNSLAIRNQVIANQRLWLAVLERAIVEWVRGSAWQKQKADRFLFHDKDDFPFVCHFAGLNPGSVREALRAIRAQTASGSNRNAA
jgi:hypothetical protein